MTSIEILAIPFALIFFALLVGAWLNANNDTTETEGNPSQDFYDTLDHMPRTPYTADMDSTTLPVDITFDETEPIQEQGA